LCVITRSAGADKPFGFVEIKYPFSVRHLTPTEAAHTPGFCSVTDDLSNIILKKKHTYFAQIQGQMALGERPQKDPGVILLFTPKQTLAFSASISIKNIGKKIYPSSCHFMITV